MHNVLNFIFFLFSFSVIFNYTLEKSLPSSIKYFKRNHTIWECQRKLHQISYTGKIHFIQHNCFTRGVKTVMVKERSSMELQWNKSQGNFFFQFIIEIIVVGIHCYNSFRCTAQRFAYSIYYSMFITVCVVIICHHATWLYYWLYPLCCTF